MDMSKILRVAAKAGFTLARPLLDKETRDFIKKGMAEEEAEELEAKAAKLRAKVVRR